MSDKEDDDGLPLQDLYKEYFEGNTNPASVALVASVLGNVVLSRDIMLSIAKFITLMEVKANQISALNDILKDLEKLSDGIHESSDLLGKDGFRIPNDK